MKPTGRGRTAVIAAVAVAVFVTSLTPALAQSPLDNLERDCAITNIWCGAKCGGAPIVGNVGPKGPCDFCDALVVARNITVLLMWFATLAAVIMIVVGALMMLFAAGSEERFASGKKTIMNAVIGLAIALAAWLAVNTVFQFLAPGGANVPWAQINCVSSS